MSGAPDPGATPVVPGRTTIESRALRHLAVGLAHEKARVDARDVSVVLSDAGGALVISVVLPVVVSQPAVTIPEQSERLRRGLIDGFRTLANRTVRAVDVRFSGLRDRTTDALGTTGRRVA